MKKISILFVCLGNICRSPMAEYFMKDLVEKEGLDWAFHIESAATSREEVGNGAYPPARRELQKHGISCTEHRSRQMTAEDCLRFDYLIGMDGSNIRSILRLCGSENAHKVSRLLAIPDLLSARFTYTAEGMDKVAGKPCLILMNHSSFIDLKIAYKIFFPRPLSIVCTSDGFVGKYLLMRLIGCIPTNKFVSDVKLIGDMQYALRELGSSVLMYPEASYSFDGTATPLPRKLGVLLKKLRVPVVTVTTSGAFSREPLYNCLQKRSNVPVSAKVQCLLTPEEIAEMPVGEIDALLDRVFTFDGFAWQQKNNIVIDSPTRADGLNRILYRCAHCGTEGEMEGRGIFLKCRHCGKVWELTPQGQLRALSGPTEFAHIPHWYDWERQEVRRELTEGTYRLDTEVDIGMMVNYKAIYMVGSGRLTHDENGFTLTGCDGQLQYTQPPLACYSLYADYYWYELGDVICIGDNNVLYYCFPKGGDVVAKTRQATEELYKLKKRRPVRAKREAAAVAEEN